MAKHLSNDSARVGKLVYKFGQPGKIGVIRNLSPGVRGAVRCEIEWTDGSISHSHATSLNDFDGLIDETQHKLGTHLSKRAAAEAKLGLGPR